MCFGCLNDEFWCVSESYGRNLSWGRGIGGRGGETRSHLRGWCFLVVRIVSGGGILGGFVKGFIKTFYRRLCGRNRFGRYEMVVE